MEKKIATPEIMQAFEDHLDKTFGDDNDARDTEILNWVDKIPNATINEYPEEYQAKAAIRWYEFNKEQKALAGAVLQSVHEGSLVGSNKPVVALTAEQQKELSAISTEWASKITTSLNAKVTKIFYSYPEKHILYQGHGAQVLNAEETEKRMNKIKNDANVYFKEREGEYKKGEGLVLARTATGEAAKEFDSLLDKAKNGVPIDLHLPERDKDRKTVIGFEVTYTPVGEQNSKVEIIPNGKEFINFLLLHLAGRIPTDPETGVGIKIARANKRANTGANAAARKKEDQKKEATTVVKKYGIYEKDAAILYTEAAIPDPSRKRDSLVRLDDSFTYYKRVVSDDNKVSFIRRVWRPSVKLEIDTYVLLDTYKGKLHDINRKGFVGSGMLSEEEKVQYIDAYNEVLEKKLEKGDLQDLPSDLRAKLQNIIDKKNAVTMEAVNRL